VVPTFLGAHAVPPEYGGRSQEYVDLICNEMMPAVAKRKLAEFVDVFCDRGAFSAAETEQIFAAAEKHKLAVRAHMGQLSETRLGPILRYRPASLDHMDYVNDADLPRSRRVTRWQLSCREQIIFSAYRGIRTRDSSLTRCCGCAGDGLQPGVFANAQHADGDVAGVHANEDVAREAIAATTINGAWALRLADRKGSVEPGKDADLAEFDVKDYREIPYWFGAIAAL